MHNVYVLYVTNRFASVDGGNIDEYNVDYILQCLPTWWPLCGRGQDLLRTRGILIGTMCSHDCVVITCCWVNALAMCKCREHNCDHSYCCNDQIFSTVIDELS